MTHGELVNMVLVRFSKPQLRVWKNVTGVFDAPNGAKIRVGLKGSADILGIRSDGKMVCIEIKVGHDQQRQDQKSFENMINLMHGIYVIVHDTDKLDTKFQEVTNGNI
jgi:hypothetical protein